jgi:hypothetical protein
MSETHATVFKQHLLEHASQYFADFEQGRVDVQLINELKRRQSTLYRFQVGSAGLRRSVLVKVSSLSSRGENRANEEAQLSIRRPRLAAVADPESKFQLEWAALSAIQDYFQSLHDPRFGTIPMLDLLPDYRAFMMEEVKHPNLRQLFMRTSRLAPPWKSIDLTVAFRNAGAWLSAYHALPKHNYVEPRHTQRSEFIDSIDMFTDFLANALGNKPFWQKVASISEVSALDILPETLPLGLGHGDFAMRNILVEPTNRVIVLDTLARWRIPIYEDIAYFLTELRTSWPQVLSQGLVYNSGRLGCYEREFLNGYFGQEAVPLCRIRLYEIQTLLDKWASWLMHGKQQGTGIQAMARKLRFASLNSYFHKRMEYLLLEISRR